jgi:hypothetical protein
MRTAMLRVLPTVPPGLNAKELKEAVIPHLSGELFPGGAKAGWWMKCVQLDLEAKGAIKRMVSKPLRWTKS